MNGGDRFSGRRPVFEFLANHRDVEALRTALFDTNIRCSHRIFVADKNAELAKDVQDTIHNLKQTDPSLDKFFKDSHGYAVFPTIIKGGLVVGGAGGKGEVFEKGKMIGWSSLSQGSIGLQIGGQAYREIIFFQTKEAIDKFKSGCFEFAGQASGVAVRAGGAANADYANGVAVFTMPKAGLMGEASIGGQQFTYRPK